MLDPATLASFTEAISVQIRHDSGLISSLRDEVRPLEVRPLTSQTSASIAIIATDGGNICQRFDPLRIELVRVVDSSDNQYCFEVLSPTLTIPELSRRQFTPDPTPLGRMMRYLGVREMSELSYMIQPGTSSRPRSSQWVKAYRELMEWAVLFSIIREKDFAADTIIVFDGLLRSKAFAGDLFVRYRQGLAEAINQRRREGRTVFVVGVAKQSKVLDRYRMVLDLEALFSRSEPCFVPVPTALEEESYIWPQYAWDDEHAAQHGSINLQVAGSMFFVKFGPRAGDHVWPVDILLSQRDDPARVLSYLVADAECGFPVLFYPHCLQQAHANAALVGFDRQILQDVVLKELRKALGEGASRLDTFLLRDTDPAGARYV